MTTGWIDFRALRAKLDFARVLKDYGVELKSKGRQAQAFCPLPSHKGRKRSPSFSVNIEKGLFQCFGCSAKGNVLDFVSRMEGLDPFKGTNIRTVAVKLQEKYGIAGSNGAKRSDNGNGEKRQESRDLSRDSQPRNDLPVVVNAPLDFELQSLDAKHPYLFGRGFGEETIKTFGLGFCNRGLFKGRIVIPIHDGVGQLVGYAGRVIDDRAISDENPKYKLPPPRERDGKRFEFHKSLLLYNAHRVKERVTDIIVVEGFPSVWWLHQHGYTEVVALIGADCSAEQAKLIVAKVEFDGRVWVLSDGDEAGARCANTLVSHVAPHRFVRWVKLRDDEQPTDLNADELTALLSF